MFVTERFQLNSITKRSLRQRKERFGFGLLGFATYARTYSRTMADGRQERWADTVIRVVEGVFSIRKDWMLSHRLGWDETGMQTMAAYMADAIYTMKFLPSGRNLWATGSEYMYQRGGLALNNCAYVHIIDLGKDSGSIMNMLLKGVGVGFGFDETFKPTMEKQTETTYSHVIEDTGEAWAESVAALISTILRGEPTPVFDYSKIRLRGAPIRGFGGTASGPEPLIALHDQIRQYLATYYKEKNATRLIADIVNSIGGCVVAGNVRRSAELMLGSPNDDTFLDLKNYTKNPDRQSIGWMCLPDNTWIHTKQGPRQISDLVETPFVALVDGKEYPSRGFFFAGDKSLVRIEAQGYQLESSPDHKIMTTRGWVRAEDLKIGDTLCLQDQTATEWSGQGTEDEGYVIGSLVGDGWIDKRGRACITSYRELEGNESTCQKLEEIVNFLEEGKTGYAFNLARKDRPEYVLSCQPLARLAARFGVVYEKKTVTPQIEAASSDFYKGFLRGLFDTDGSVEILGTTKNSRGVRLAQSSKEIMSGVQRMLARLGIQSKVHHIAHPSGFTPTKEAYVLYLRGNDAKVFGNLIGFGNDKKQASLLDDSSVNRAKPKRLQATVESIHQTSELVPMYDCMVEDVHAYDANGIYVSNSNNSIRITEHDHFLKIPELTERIITNGEPGFVNMINVKKYGRYGELSPDTAEGTNPSLRAGTLVYTSDGIVPIEQLEGETFTVRNLRGEEQEATCWLSGTDEPLIKVTLANGQSYYATEEHKWPVIDSRGNTKKKNTSALQVGDFLPVVQQSSLGFGTEGTRDEGFLAGWLTGDGWITTRGDNNQRQFGLILSEKDEPEIRPILERVLLSLGCQANFVRRERGTSVWYELNTQSENCLGVWADRFGIRNKREGLPTSLWSTASEDFRKGFIDGLFSSDGHVQKNRIGLVSAHKKLIEEVQTLLGFYGINSYMQERETVGSFPNKKDYQKKYVSYALRFGQAVYLDHFAQTFPLSLSAKNDRLQVNHPRNHRGHIKVVSVEQTDLRESVWDIRVDDDTHCFQLAYSMTGNCAEATLESYELCCLVEIFPSLCKNEEEFYRVTRLATFFASTVSLLLTEVPEINAVVTRNHRIGVSMSGIADLFDKVPTTQVIRMARKGYRIVEEENQRCAREAGVPESIRKTVVKPSGTVSLLAGVSPGMHYPPFTQYVRRMRVAEDSPLVSILSSAGVYAEPDEYSANTMVFEFPVRSEARRSQRDLTIWQKAAMLTMLQQHWADQMVSNTLTFDPKTEGDQLADLLAMTLPAVKSLSLLADDKESGVGYAQAPYSPIDNDTFEKMSASIGEVDWTKFEGSDGEDVLFCESDNCQV